MSDTVSMPRRGFPFNDLKSGFLVFLIALPLCLGIAMASGFPPVAGVMTAVVGGVVVSFVGSSRLTIKGPAAGLIVIAIGAVQDLGQGDPVAGYRRALAVGVVAALLQLVLALARVATLGIAMSPSVVHGMLAAIGVIIISKQSHTLLGVAPQSSEPLALLMELPRSVVAANPEIALLGLLSLSILFGLPYIRQRWVKLVPAPIVALVVTVPLALWFDLHHSHHYQLFAHDYQVGPQYLVRLPSSLSAVVTFPDFSVVCSVGSLKYIVMFTLVGTIESTLSVLAVDSMDPRKEASNLNRDLLGTSVGNLVSALLGGLPMISEIVRSKANVDAGAESPWSNFFHGALLLLFVALAPGLLGEIPLAVLAGMLVFTGTRLASPMEFIRSKHVGPDQLLLFVVTLGATLASDLLVGVGTGLALKLCLHVARGVSFADLFRPRVTLERQPTLWTVKVEGAATFAALLPIRRQLATVPPEIVEVVIDFANAKLIDHTFMSRLRSMAREWPNAELVLHGLERFEATSSHPDASRRLRRST